MKLILDTEAETLVLDEPDGCRTLPLHSKEAFEALSLQWLRMGWNAMYPLTFSWLGRPIIQLPEDLIRMQEVVHRIRPDVIIETGIAHGGSMVFYASLCKAIGTGRIVGIDIAIAPDVRRELEAHPLAGLITLVEGGSTAPDVVARVKAEASAGTTVLVILDSDHSYAHVTAELEAYAALVSVGSYIVVADGIMRELADLPNGSPSWATDNPAAAARDFAARHPEFAIEQPPWPFRQSGLEANVTYWPGGWLRRLPS
jgi:cephalosporin hydroxylase